MARKNKAALAEEEAARVEREKVFIQWAHAFMECKNEKTAAISIGIPSGEVDSFLAQVPYSVEAQRVLAQDVAHIPDFNDVNSVKAAVFKQLWREARQGGVTAASARVSALKAIAEFSGMGEPAPEKGAGNTGGMLFIPVMKMDDWEKACSKAQLQLRAAVHE